MLKYKTFCRVVALSIRFSKRIVSYGSLFVALMLCPLVISANQKQSLTTKRSSSSNSVNTLTKAEKAAGWKLLFDGKTTAGWRGFKKQDFPKSGWIVEDGCLKLLAKDKRGSGDGGDIISTDKFNDFELQFEWRVAPGGNSGVKYFITEEREGAIGHEYQTIDEAGYAGKLGIKQTTAGLYDVLPPNGKRVLRPAGEFNHSRIIVNGKHVEHWLNGAKVLEYQLESEALKAGIAESKFKNVAGWGTKFSTPILLQDHGDEVCFRNLKIRELPAR